MVESEAKELSEEIMLGAVMFGHRHIQPVIEAIIQLAEKAAKEPREFAQPDTKAIEKEMLGIVEADLREAYAIPRKAERHDAVAAVKKKAMEHFFPDGKDNPERPMQLVAGVFKELEAKIVRWNILDTTKRIDGRDLVTVRPIVVRSAVPAAHPRLGAVHPRRDPGDRRRHARHRRRRAVDRRAAGNVQGSVHAALQLPALLGRRDRPHGRARPPRNRPRQARLARDPSDAAVEGRVPLHHPRRVGDHRVERLVVDGDGVRHLARADGRGRAAEAADRRHRHGPHPRGQALRRAVRHPRRRGSSRRHGLQGGRHRGGRHLAADGHQDRRHHRRDHEGRARSGQGRPPAHPRRDGQGARPRRAPSSANTRRASRPSRSRPTRSAK